MIRTGDGNLLRADVDALVNTVNTVGVMGKGIALQFKRAYPSMYKAYEGAAKNGEIRLGRMSVWETNQMTGPRYIINFPTKKHWKAKSRLADIESGLIDLIRVVDEYGIKSIAVPPLGCGNGGLDWADVEPLIVAAFQAIPEVDVLLYPPTGTPSAASMPTNEPRPPMTAGRAALIALLDGYSSQAEASTSLIESQKLMYFLQVAGEPLSLRYEKAWYGPYADNLRHVLKVVEGHYLRGFGDGATAVMDAEPLDVLPGALDAAQAFLDGHPDTGKRIERVLELANGYETPYGLELLASVHWIAKEDPRASGDADLLVKEVQKWTPRKGRMFSEMHIRRAWENLRGKGWVTEPAHV
ncbi:macro domain-containing protein [Mycolicibacterium novocastrense]|uniref:Macro domain-containing protein n=1 Tax=Mycolicibacterium novocastrense TaxID=59813 RepID=A0AAW5STK3_MYCNV|nr:macro domain-containing protein [Mycolicibacterium novocastrense]MCV7027503.1 macro domain-containing protein [Mycolicibacterium novocastrense]